MGNNLSNARTSKAFYEAPIHAPPSKQLERGNGSRGFRIAFRQLLEYLHFSGYSYAAGRLFERQQQMKKSQKYRALREVLNAKHAM